MEVPLLGRAVERQARQATLAQSSAVRASQRAREPYLLSFDSVPRRRVPDFDERDARKFWRKCPSPHAATKSARFGYGFGQ